MAQMMMDCILIGEVETKDIMTKSSLPVGGYSVNPYVGCTHACRYCYASFMKRFTGHTEEWGTFLDVKHWPEIKNPRKYAGQRVVIGSVTDGYNPQEEVFQNTRKLLEQLRGSGADILICTKSERNWGRSPSPGQSIRWTRRLRTTWIPLFPSSAACPP